MLHPGDKIIKEIGLNIYIDELKFRKERKMPRYIEKTNLIYLNS